MKKFIKENYLYILIIFFISFLLLSLALKNNLIIKGHDGEFHYANIYSLKELILNGNIFPRVYPNIAKNYGYGTGLLYGYLPHYITAIISIIFNISIFMSLKIVSYLCIFLSGLFMYILSLRCSKNKDISLVSSIGYISMPYFLSDIYVRSALCEYFSYIFLPMIFIGLYDLLYENKEKSFYIYFVIGSSLLLMTHLITTLYTILFGFIFLIINIKTVLKPNNINALCKSIIMILGITSFSWIQLIIQRINSSIVIFNYSFNYEDILDQGLVLKNISPINTLLVSNYVNSSITMTMLVMIIISVIMLIKNRKEKDNRFFISFLVLGIISLFMSTKYFPWKYLPSLFYTIQFSWRLSLFYGFFFSLFCIYGLIKLKRYFNKDSLLVCMIIIMSLLVGSFVTIDDSYIFKNYNEEEVDISGKGKGVLDDYLPVNTVNNPDYYIERNNDIYILSGNGDINIIKNNVPNIIFNLDIKSDNVEIELPLFYYYGYSLKNKDTNKKYDIKEDEYGFISTKLDESGTYEIDYTGSIYEHIANIISLLSIVISSIYIYKIKS